MWTWDAPEALGSAQSHSPLAIPPPAPLVPSPPFPAPFAFPGDGHEGGTRGRRGEQVTDPGRPASPALTQPARSVPFPRRHPRDATWRTHSQPLRLRGRGPLREGRGLRQGGGTRDLFTNRKEGREPRAHKMSNRIEIPPARVWPADCQGWARRTTWVEKVNNGHVVSSWRQQTIAPHRLFIKQPLSL